MPPAVPPYNGSRQALSRNPVHPLGRGDGWTGLPYRTRATGLFQSSPDPKAGCDINTSGLKFRGLVFQSSPDPKAGCDSNHSKRSRTS